MKILNNFLCGIGVKEIVVVISRINTKNRIMTLLKNHLRSAGQLTLIFAGLLLATSCEPGEDAGPPTTEVRSIESYSGVDVRGDFQVDIISGADTLVEVYAPDNLMAYIDIFVSGSTLIIAQRNNNIKGGPTPRIILSETALKRIELSGSGRISGVTITSDVLEIRLQGSGVIDLPVVAHTVEIDLEGSGKVRSRGDAFRLKAEIEGSGRIETPSLVAAQAAARITGSGIIDLFVSESLEAHITGSGIIRYWGNPQQVDQVVSGSGKVMKL